MRRRTDAEIKANDEANHHEHLRHMMEMEERTKESREAERRREEAEKEESFEEWNRKFNAERQAYKETIKNI